MEAEHRGEVSLFVDTSVWYAVADKRDGGNARAKSILDTDEPLVMTDHVLVETWMLLERRLGHRVAETFWEGLRTSGATVESVGIADLEVAWSIGQTFSDQEFSMIDRTSFAVMERLGIHRVASLDAHFAIYRFGPRRDRAFTVLN